MIDMIVFDMAGTTVNENNLVYKTLRQAILDAGQSVPLKEVLLHGAGKEKRQAIRDILSTLPEGDSVDSESIYQAFRAQLDYAYLTTPIHPFEGAEDVFAWLRARNIAIVLNTGYDRATAELLLQRLGWEVGQDIDLLVTADDVSRGRPHPDMILYAMQQLAPTQPQKAVKIGDSIVDIQEGKAAGCGLTIGITTGAQPRNQLLSAEPDHVIDSLLELKELVAELVPTSEAS